MLKYIKFSIFGLALLATHQALALTGDTNGDGYADTIYLEGDYVKIKDGKYSSNIRSYYIGSGTKNLLSLNQLDKDNNLEVVVTIADRGLLYIIDDNGGYPTKYSVYRNGATGNQDYIIRAIDDVNSSTGNEIVIMYPNDNYLWVINHSNNTLTNYIVNSNPSSFTLIDTDGAAGKDIVLGYDSLGLVTIVSTNPIKTPYVRDYHKNYGTNTTRDRIYGFTDTDGKAGSEIILYSTSGSSSLYVIRDASNPWSYGEERSFNLNGSYQIFNITKNRDGQAGNDICYKNTNSSSTYYSLNTNSGSITPTPNCN